MGNSNGASATTPSNNLFTNGTTNNNAVIFEEDESSLKETKSFMPGVFGVTNSVSPNQQLRFTNHLSTLQNQQNSGNKSKSKSKDQSLNSSFGKLSYFDQIIYLY